MATLYEINDQIMALIDEETGEITDIESLNALQIERDTKIENIALWIKNLKADAETFKAEKQAFEERQKRAEKKAESLKNYLVSALDGQKFKTARVECSYRSSESVNVTDITVIPTEYLRFAEPTADKTAIKAAIKAGKEIAGAEIVLKQNLLIK